MDTTSTDVETLVQVWPTLKRRKVLHVKRQATRNKVLSMRHPQFASTQVICNQDFILL
jgi:hypothetical protein